MKKEEILALFEEFEQTCMNVEQSLADHFADVSNMVGLSLSDHFADVSKMIDLLKSVQRESPFTYYMVA